MHSELKADCLSLQVLLIELQNVLLDALETLHRQRLAQTGLHLFVHLLLALGPWREARVLYKGDLLNFIAKHKEHLKGVEILVRPELWVHTIDSLLILLVTCLLMQLL